MLEVAIHSCGAWQGGIPQSAGEESEGCRMHSELVCTEAVHELEARPDWPAQGGRAVDTVSIGGQCLLALLLSNEVYISHLPSPAHL